MQTDSQSIPPNTCRVTATIVRVYAPATSGADSVCARFPCRATIRIKTVHSYGSSFSGAINAGDELAVHFAFSLEPTQKLFPQHEHPLPGLKADNEFTALLYDSELLQSSVPTYTIYDYQKH